MASTPPIPPQQSMPPVASNVISLSTLIIGLISVLALALFFAMANEVISPDIKVMQIAFDGSAALGAGALVLGIITLTSRRSRSKWMAVIGMILGIPAIVFFLYVRLFL